MSQLGSLLVQVCKPSVRHSTIMTLTGICLKEHGPTLGSALAAALIKELPPEKPELVLDPINRFGTRMAFGITLETFPLLFRELDRFEKLRRFCRLVIFTEICLRQHQAVLHLKFAQAFREHLSAYMHLVNAVREVADSERINPALLGCLVEQAIIAATSSTPLAAGIGARLLAKAGKERRTRFLRRFEATVAEAMANPLAPELSPAPASAGEFFAQILSGDEPSELAMLLSKFKVNALLYTDSTSRPQFSRPLTLDERFQSAARQLPLRIRESMVRAECN